MDLAGRAPQKEDGDAKVDNADKFYRCATVKILPKRFCISNLQYTFTVEAKFIDVADLPALAAKNKQSKINPCYMFIHCRRISFESLAELNPARGLIRYDGI